MEVNKLLITFSGNKASLHTQLKEWCKESNQSMNGTVVELIKKHLENNQPQEL